MQLYKQTQEENNDPGLRFILVPSSIRSSLDVWLPVLALGRSAVPPPSLTDVNQLLLFIIIKIVETGGLLIGLKGYFFIF